MSCDLGKRRVSIGRQFANLVDLGDFQLGPRVTFSSSTVRPSQGVQLVVRFRDIFEVIWATVSLVAVDMIDLQSHWSGTVKRLCNQNMDKLVFNLAVDRDQNVGVSFGAAAYSSDQYLASVAPHAPNSAVRAGIVVSLSAWNRKPLLIARIGGTWPASSRSCRPEGSSAGKTHVPRISVLVRAVLFGRSPTAWAVRDLHDENVAQQVGGSQCGCSMTKSRIGKRFSLLPLFVAHGLGVRRPGSARFFAEGIA